MIAEFTRTMPEIKFYFPAQGKGVQPSDVVHTLLERCGKREKPNPRYQLDFSDIKQPPSNSSGTAQGISPLVAFEQIAIGIASMALGALFIHFWKKFWNWLKLKREGAPESEVKEAEEE